MKDRVREAVFNLVGPIVKEALAIDLFAGTGALGLEALSRGAHRAHFIERHFPTADSIRRNVVLLEFGDRGEVTAADVFWWAPRAELPQDRPWVVFCSPPYELYSTRSADMRELIGHYVHHAPRDSCLVVECDEHFELASLPDAENWNIRQYPPAVIAIYRAPGPDSSSPELGSPEIPRP